METETIQKNVASLKSQMSKRNFKKILFVALIASLFFSCSEQDHNVVNEDITKSIDNGHF